MANHSRVSDHFGAVAANYFNLKDYDVELTQAAGQSRIIFEIHRTSVQPSFWSKILKASNQNFKSGNVYCTFDLTDDILKLTFKINDHDLPSKENRMLIFDCLHSSFHDMLKPYLELSRKNEVDVVNDILDVDLDELLWPNSFSCKERMDYTKIFDAKDTIDLPELTSDTVSDGYDLNAGEKSE